MGLERFDELVRKRQELLAWSKNIGNVDCVSRKFYALRVDVPLPSLVAYCGQSYPVANNYHNAPKWFLETVRQAISKEARNITLKAIADTIAELDSKIIAEKTSVMALFSECEVSASNHAPPPTDGTQAGS